MSVFNCYIIRTPANIKHVVLEGFMTLIREQLERGKNKVDNCSEFVLTKHLFSVIR